MKRNFGSKDWGTNPNFRRLCEAFLKCKSMDETANFLRDIATLSELRSMSERLEVASMLAEGIPYRTIAQKPGLSTTTITRVAQFINDGEGGYNFVLGTNKPVGTSASEHHHPGSHEESAESMM